MKMLNKFILVGLLFFSLNTWLHANEFGQATLSATDELLKFDSFFNSESKRTKNSRIDFFAGILKEKNEVTAFIVSYGSLARLDCESLENLKYIRDYLSKKKGLSLARITFIDGGYAAKGMTDFYLIPKGSKLSESYFKWRLNDVLNPEGKSDSDHL